MRFAAAGMAALLVALGAAGCSLSKPAKPAVQVDPNAYPANYRNEIASLLRTMLTNRLDFSGAFISQPVLKQVGDSQHYVVCVQLNGSEHKDKAAIFLAGGVNQFIQATPELCGDAVYQPFGELAGVVPSR